MLRSSLSPAVLILISVAFAGCCRLSTTRSKEAVLRQDLKVMRDEIDNYRTDKEKAPQALQDLVEAGYLRKIPQDPFPDSAETWRVETSETLTGHKSYTGISDVHSGSNLVSCDGTPYRSW
jgi:general secretion pathway protein G